MAMQPGMSYRFVTRDLTNLSLLRRRKFDALLVTMHQSGTHWLIHLLSYILSRQYTLPMQSDLDVPTLISRANEAPLYDNIPYIGHTHTIPSWLVHSLPFRSTLEFPKTILLVRDIRSSMVACFDRYGYKTEFSTYVRGDPWKRRYRKDIWRDIRFLNAWDTFRKRMPERFLLVRYEDMQADAKHELARVTDFLGWDTRETLLDEAIDESSKDKMARKEVSTSDKPIVRNRKRHPFTWYSEEDRAFLTSTLSKYLHNSFGFDYSDWSHPSDG
jgi:hypothetical protein